MTLIITTSALAWSYKSFKELTGSIDRLSEPNPKLTLINNILRDFISAENNVQRYIITGNVKAARTYEEQVDKTRLKIKGLKELLRADIGQLSRVDSLEVVFQKKLDYLNRFLTLKKKRQATTFTRMALDQIEASTKDTTGIEKGLGVEKASEKSLLHRDSLRGLWQSLRVLFGQQGIPYDTANWSGEDYLSYLADPNEIANDTQFDRDSILARVKAILAETGDIELQMQQSLTQREYALLNQGRIFMTEIQSIITELETNERRLTEARKEEASAIATNSTRIIGLIGLGGLLIAVLLLILISRDITRASYFRRQLENAKLKAEQFGKMKESFLANMSHEIRTPLNSILGFSKLLKSTKLSYDQQNYMNAVNSSSTYLMELVNDILDHSKIESGKLELSNEPFDTNALAKDIEGIFLLMAENKQLVFEVTIGEDVPKWLKGDPFRLKQVLNNLLSNALKFTHKGRIDLKIEGKWFKEVFYLEVLVSDTGIGIELDKLETIFESFKQEEVSTADHFGGTGLGLSICKELAEAMGGTITATSKKGVGTTFTFKLPLEKIEEGTPDKEKTADSSEQLYDARVVLVEDDHWNALLLETLLKKKTSNVQVFLSAKEAVDYITSHKNEIDLLFTDLKMPEMSGQELAKASREVGYKQGIIAVTAHLPRDKAAGLEYLGIQAVCTKPYDEQQIDELLSQFLDQFKTALKADVAEELDTQKRHAIDLTDLNQFAGNDPEVLHELLSELVENNGNQIRVFKELSEKGDWSGLADLAHKMVPTYDHTRVHHISELLRSIELYHELSNDRRVEELSSETLLELHSCFESFVQVKAQYHTA